MNTALRTGRVAFAENADHIKIQAAFEGLGLRLGAPLAYYSVFSFGPLLLIVTAVAGFFL